MFIYIALVKIQAHAGNSQINRSGYIQNQNTPYFKLGTIKSMVKIKELACSTVQLLIAENFTNEQNRNKKDIGKQETAGNSIKDAE